MIMKLEDIKHGYKFIDRDFTTWIFVGLCPTVEGAGVFVGDDPINRRAESIHLCELVPFPNDGEMEVVKMLLRDQGSVDFHPGRCAYRALSLVRQGWVKSHS